MARLAWLLFALPLCYVLPSARVLEQIEAARRQQVGVHVVAQLAGSQPDWPTRVEADLHPVFGARFDDGSGGRWVMRGGRQIASSRGGELPAWIPQLEPLALASRQGLAGWLTGFGVDWEINELGRCGMQDCFVLGGRAAQGQLWIEKDRFEVRRIAAPLGRSYAFEEYRDFEGRRFPGAILVLDGDATLATWTPQSVYDVPALRELDFSAAWARP
jgi:hypothetical protein